MTTLIGNIRTALMSDGIQRWTTRNGPTWMVRVGSGLMDWAEVGTDTAAHLDHLLAVGDIAADDQAETGIALVRYAMHGDERHVDALKRARRGRLYSADGYNYFTGPIGGPARMLDEDQIEAVGDLVHHGYLHETKRPGPDGTTIVDISHAGLAGLKQWDA